MKIDRELIYKLLKQVPKGKVTSYKALATAAGNPKASRAVGVFMKTNPYAPHVPCHRVVCSDGRLGGFSGRTRIDDKIKMLKDEGVTVKDGRILDFKKHYFNNFSIEKAKREVLP
ncbi:MAG: MGMT family protein [Nitrososphaeria archaeon]|nr:MGMT family protein [Nitrososphaeria archaeon]